MSSEDVAAHTPGPWVIETGLKSPHWISAGNKDLALVLSMVPGSREVLPRDANARLIAAAPELLAAAEAALEALQDAQGEWLVVADGYAPVWTHPLKRTSDALAEAIRKAKGLTL